jgi:hypothetical protein
MNAGLVEETGKVATGVIDALKTSPMSLAMILTNATLLVFLFYSQNQFFENRQELTKIVLESEREVRLILSKCVVPDRTSTKSILRLPEPPVPDDHVEQKE